MVIDKRILIAAGAVLVVGTAVFFLRGTSGETACNEPKIFFNKKEAVAGATFKVTQGEALEFAGETEGGADWLWDFGDGSQAVSSKGGSHTFNLAGMYPVKLTVNGKCVGLVSVSVVPGEDEPKPGPEVRIIAPTSAKVGQPIKFACATPGVSSYEWQFGVSGGTDSKDASPTYTFKEPDVYTVSLYTNLSKSPVRHEIRVTPASVPGGTTGGGKGPVVTENEIMKRLQAITTGKQAFDKEFPILKQKLQMSMMPVNVNGKEVVKLQDYCNSLWLQSGLRITAVRFTRDGSGNITGLTVTQK